MSVPGPGLTVADDARLPGLLSTLRPPASVRATLATTTDTTPSFAGADDEFTQSSYIPNSEHHQDGRRQATFLLLFAEAIPLVLLATTTVVCNLMVLWMFRVKRSLRSCKNMYLASLALADLLIGGCMYVATVQQLRGQGPVLVSGALGAAYHVIRQAALYVSLLSLLLITVDRWWSIHRPFSYRAKRRKRNAAVAVGTVWVLGFAVHIVPLIVWEAIGPDHLVVLSEEQSTDTVVTTAAVGLSIAPPVNTTATNSSSPLDIFATLVHNATTNSSTFRNATMSILFSASPSAFLFNHSDSNPTSTVLDSVTSSMFVQPSASVHAPVPPHSSLCQQQHVTPEQHASPCMSHGLPLYEGLPLFSSPALLSLAWDIQYLVPLITMLTLNCSLYVGILGRKRVQIRRSLTSFNRLSSSLYDRRYSVSSMPTFYCEASSSLDENAELLITNGKCTDNDSGGGGGSGSGGGGGGGITKASMQRSTASITNINTKFNFYSTSTATYKQLQQQQHRHQSRQNSTSTLRSSVSMPHVHMSSVDTSATLHDMITPCNGYSTSHKGMTTTTILNNNNNTNNNNNHAVVPNGVHSYTAVVPPLRRFSWAPRKSSLALNRRSKGSEELAKDLLVRQDRKAACWLGLLVVVFLACWLPHSILRVVRALQAPMIPAWACEAATWLQLANSCINPLLYGFFNKEIRQAFKQWMRGSSRRKRAKFKNALLLYGVNLSSGAGGQTLSARRMSLFDTVHE